NMHHPILHLSLSSYYSKDLRMPLKILEKSLENEMTLVYFINLMNSAYVPVVSGQLASAIIQGELELQKKYPQENILPMAPRNKLKVLLKADSEISLFISQLKDDMLKYFEELSGSITGL